MAITVSSWPAALAASRTRKGNRPLPAIRPRRITRSFVDQHFLDSLGGAAQRDTPLRGADEVDEILHVEAGDGLIAFDLAQGLSGVELRLEKVPEGPFELGNDVEAEPPTRQPQRVQPVDARAIADRLGKRQRVLGDDRVAADKRVTADAAVLVDT